jgi:ubiquinone/menaquinone biosynthesis C-methylase UbiE
MSVASHLKIKLKDYDRRVRTFIPAYEELLDAAAEACATALGGIRRPTIVDLGIGTGALASRCLDRVPHAAIVGIDNDPEILRVAMRRLSRRGALVTLIRGDFARTAMPSAHAVVATLALHHLHTGRTKQAFYRRCADVLCDGGAIVTGDCHPSSMAWLARQQMESWRSHMRKTYSAAETRRFLRAWSDEDTYMTLEAELRMMRKAGFAADVVWRRGAFAVLVGRKPQAARASATFRRA